jgi:hypothetical protein
MVESSYTIGMINGRIEGKKEQAVAISINLLKAGVLDIQTIAEMTGLTIEETEAVRKALP